MPEGIININAPAAVNTSGDILTAIIMIVGFFIFTFIVILIFWLWETRGNRLFWLKNGVMRKMRFSDKDITPEGFLKVNKQEAIKISTQPINLKNVFGSTNPTYFADANYPLTLYLNRPIQNDNYPSPSMVNEGISETIMRELQTYQVAKDKGASFGLIAIGAIIGLFGGVFLAGAGVLG